MGWLLDVIILLIIGITVFISYKKGFVKTLVSASAFLIAILITALFARPFADFLKDTAIAKSVERSTEQKIIEIIEEKSFELDDLIEGKSEDFNRLASIAGVNRNNLEKNQEAKQAAKEERIEKIAERISEPIIDTAASILSVILLYILVQVGLSVGGFFLDKLANLPILKTANKVLGIVLGVILALFRVFLFCFIMKVLIEVGGFIGNDFLCSFEPEKTILFRFISQINLFSFFI